jgi:WD40 repeat protein
MSSKPIAEKTFFTGSYDGRIHAYDLGDSSCKAITGAGHTNAVVALVASEDGRAFSAAMDDTIREVKSEHGVYSFSYVSVLRVRVHPDV